MVEIKNTIESQGYQTDTGLVVPSVDLMAQEAKRKIKGQDKNIDIIFDEINNQAVDSFDTHRSEKFPGVSFSTILLRVTPGLIREIQNKNHKANVEDISKRESISESAPERIYYFYEPHFAPSLTTGNAFFMLENGIDRFIREMPKIANALKAGSQIPDVRIYLLGSPLALGGTVSEEWVRRVRQEGFNKHGELYAEFIKETVGEVDENTRVIVGGYSKGAVTAERTFHHLVNFYVEKAKAENGHTVDFNEDAYRKFLYQHIQGLYDAASAIHKRGNLLRTDNLAGLILEDTVRRFILREKYLISGLEKEKAFWPQLVKVKNIPEVTSAQKSLKIRAFGAEVLSLGIGTPPDESEPGNYRLPEFDPTNIQLRRRKLLSPQGRKRFTTIKGQIGHYYFPWIRSSKRWETIIDSISQERQDKKTNGESLASSE